jgi:hypothetical protein
LKPEEPSRRPSRALCLEASTMANPDRYSGRPPKHGRGVWILIGMALGGVLLAAGFPAFWAKVGV